MEPLRKRSEPSSKRRRVDRPDTNMREMSDDQRPSFREIESVVEQAEKYRLGTARLPIDSLSPQWHSGKGTNRQINQKHAMTLARVFYEEGLKRKSPENHL